ncbi:MAG: two component transcriptional regulator, LuxR family [Frankiales bacterium]|nr:two component transcriptional regulator, LuxR family [Frankiales bacterium]
MDRVKDAGAGLGAGTDNRVPARAGRVLVAVRQRAFAEALVQLLSVEDDLDVVGCVDRSAPVMALMRSTRPDLLLLDEQLAGAVLPDLVRDLLAVLAGVGIVVVAERARAEDVVLALRAGALAWVLKDGSSTELVDAARAVRLGRAWLPPTALREVLELLLPRPEQQLGVLAPLTVRERDVLTAMVDGLDQNAIAARLLISTNTVRTHRRNVLAKLAVHSSLEAVAVGRGAGLAAAVTPVH